MKNLLILTLAFCLISTAAFASELIGVDVYPLEKLSAGQKGTAYTVIRGTKIETFDVEILELIPKGGFDGGPMILARFSGPVVDHSKGIAGGYSGSPVYINGKLLGAVSMAIPFTDTHIGGITPIGSMLPALPDVGESNYSNNSVLPGSSNSGILLDEDGEPLAEDGQLATESDDANEGTESEGTAETESEDAGEAKGLPLPETEEAPVEAPKGVPATAIRYMDDAAEALRYNEKMRAQGISKRAAVRAKTPVLSTGFDADVLKHFAPEIKSSLGENLELVESQGIGGSAASGGPGLLMAQGNSATPPGLFFAGGADQPPLLPGAAVTVSLMQGDLEMNAIGTLTYSDPDGRFLIFGHPMMGMGPTNMPLGEGYVTWTHTSIERAFKDGVRLNTLGKLSEDRGAACGGTFNEQADMIPVKVKVKDIDLNTEKTLRFEVIRHPDFTPVLIAMGLAQASQQVLDRQLGGTLKLSYHIEGAGLREPLRRTNYYSDDANVVFNGAMEIVPITNLLETNIYREVTATKVDLMVEITRNRVNASIDEAKIVWDKEGENSGPPSISSPAKAERSEEEAAAANSDAQGEEQPNPQQPGQPGQPNQPGQAMVGPGMMGMGMVNENIPTFAPGEEIKVRVRLQPYRTDAVWREFSIKVPDDFPSGNTMIMVHGGGDLISPSELNGKGRSLYGMGPVIDVEEHDLDAILDQILQWPTNNELLVTLVRPYDPTQPQELGSAATGDGTTAEKPADKVDAKYQMEWVIYNGFMLPVNIMTKTDEATAEKMKEQMEQASKEIEQSQQGDQGAEDNDSDGPRKMEDVDRNRDIGSFVDWVKNAFSAE